MLRRLYLLLIISIGFVMTTMSQQLDLSGFIFGEFEEATIYLAGGATTNEKVNYNTVDKELYYVDRSDGYVRIVTNMEQIRAVKVKDRTFVPVHRGIQEILPTTPSIYVEFLPNIQKKGQQVGYGGTSQLTSTNVTPSMGLGSYILPDKLDVEANGFFNCYWIEQNGKKKKFANFKQLMKIYPKHKVVLEDQISKNSIEFNDSKGVANLCLFAEELK